MTSYYIARQTQIRVKNYQNTQIFMIFARKINKISEFYTILPEKCPNFT